MILKPFTNISYRSLTKPSIYLAGSLDKTDNWQIYLDKMLDELGYDIFNPRTEEYPEKGTSDYFRQINWELEGLSKANYIVMYISGNETKSNILLAHLGLWCGSDKIVVCCNEDYFLKDYVGALCQKYGVPQVKNLEEIIEYFKHLSGVHES
jgi:hypothetical protein